MKAIVISTFLNRKLSVVDKNFCNIIDEALSNYVLSNFKIFKQTV